MRRTSRRRDLYAVAAALVAHAAVLGAMGFIHPGVMAPPPDERPPVEIQLLPPLEAPTVPRAATAVALPRPARTSAPVPGPLTGLAAPEPPPPAASAAPPAVGPPSETGCGPEDLPLLTPDERARCRNQIDVARARRKQADDDAGRAARMATVRALPKIDGIAPEKRGYYDAVAAAQEAVKAGPGRGESVSGRTWGGPRLNASAGCSTTAAAAQPRLSMKVGPLHCYLDTGAPGFLTEESRIRPP